MTDHKEAESFERMPLSMARMARFVLQNYSSLKKAAKALSVVETIRQVLMHSLSTI